jgi:hypothetical protein
VFQRTSALFNWLYLAKIVVTSRTLCIFLVAVEKYLVNKAHIFHILRLILDTILGQALIEQNARVNTRLYLVWFHQHRRLAIVQRVNNWWCMGLLRHDMGLNFGDKRLLYQKLLVRPHFFLLPLLCQKMLVLCWLE